MKKETAQVLATVALLNAMTGPYSYRPKSKKNYCKTCIVGKETPEACERCEKRQPD